MVLWRLPLINNRNIWAQPFVWKSNYLASPGWWKRSGSQVQMNINYPEVDQISCGKNMEIAMAGSEASSQPDWCEQKPRQGFPRIRNKWRTGGHAGNTSKQPQTNRNEPNDWVAGPFRLRKCSASRPGVVRATSAKCSKLLPISEHTILDYYTYTIHR